MFESGSADSDMAYYPEELPMTSDRPTSTLGGLSFALLHLESNSTFEISGHRFGCRCFDRSIGVDPASL